MPAMSTVPGGNATTACTHHDRKGVEYFGSYLLLLPLVWKYPDHVHFVVERTIAQAALVNGHHETDRFFGLTAVGTAFGRGGDPTRRGIDTRDALDGLAKLRERDCGKDSVHNANETGVRVRPSTIARKQIYRALVTLEENKFEQEKTRLPGDLRTDGG